MTVLEGRISGSISIPAPARGATCGSGGHGGRPAHFNSRPCERGDVTIGRHSASGTYFNSRPCERGDSRNLKSALKDWRFQFPPLREGRPGPITASLRACLLFQFPPLREGRPAFCSPPEIDAFDFNSRPCERGDSAAQQALRIIRFQFPPLREGRRISGLPYSVA